MSDYNEYYKKAWEMNLAKQTEQIATLEAKLAKAREALEFYAEPLNWLWREDYNESLCGENQFIVAREALKEIGE